MTSSNLLQRNMCLIACILPSLKSYVYWSYVYQHFWNSFVRASLCAWYSEAKHTETLRFGAKKYLLQGHAKRQQFMCYTHSSSPTHHPELPAQGEIQQRIFKTQGREGGFRVCDQWMYNSEWLRVREQGDITELTLSVKLLHQILLF